MHGSWMQHPRWPRAQLRALAQRGESSAPRLLTRSALVMPTPESRRVSVLLVLSGCMWMNSSGSASSTLLSVSDWKRTCGARGAQVTRALLLLAAPCAQGSPCRAVARPGRLPWPVDPR